MTDLCIWVDIETTGLDYTEDALLEIGAVATTMALEPRARFSRVTCLPANWDQTAPDTWPLDDTVRDMHTRNGLLADCQAAVFGPDEDTAVDLFVDWAGDLAVSYDSERLTLAGSGIAGFDVPWIKARMRPGDPWPFHHRVLDLSPVRQLLDLAGITTHLDASSGPGKKHRALDDAEAHLAEARLLVDTLQRMRRADQPFGAQIDMQDGPHANPPGGEV